MSFWVINLVYIRRDHDRECGPMVILYWNERERGTGYFTFFVDYYFGSHKTPENTKNLRNHFTLKQM